MMDIASGLTTGKNDPCFDAWAQPYRSKRSQDSGCIGHLARKTGF
jgi:hypothetical protein